MWTTIDTTKIAACIVCYKPEPAQLRRLVDALAPQVSRILIVDNGGAESWLTDRPATHSMVEYQSMHGNSGIAAALNVAIKRAVELQMEFLALFDQDSDLRPGTLQQLRQRFNSLNGFQEKICAVGPNCVDYRQTPPAVVPALRQTGALPRRVPCTADIKALEVDFLITSGSLISLDALRFIGLFERDLFVSYVDVEWGLRAKSLGYRSIRCCDIEMPHEFGSGRYLRVLGRSVVPYQPIRYYYQARSWMMILKARYVSTGWKAQLTLWLLSQSVGVLLLRDGQMTDRMRQLVRGLIDGSRMTLGSTQRESTWSRPA